MNPNNYNSMNDPSVNPSAERSDMTGMGTRVGELGRDDPRTAAGVPGSDVNAPTCAGYKDPQGTAYGPRQSTVGSTVDPRVDSNRGNVRNTGLPGEDRNVTTGYNDPEGTHGPHQSRAANALDPQVDSDRDNVTATGASGGAYEKTSGTTTTTGGENVATEPHSGKGGGFFHSIKGRVAQAHGIGENARGQFNAAMGELLHDKKGQAKGEATAAGGRREFANKEFDRHGTLDKTL